MSRRRGLKECRLDGCANFPWEWLSPGRRSQRAPAFQGPCGAGQALLASSVVAECYVMYRRHKAGPVARTPALQKLVVEVRGSHSKASPP